MEEASGNAGEGEYRGTESARLEPPQRGQPSLSEDQRWQIRSEEVNKLRELRRVELESQPAAETAGSGSKKPAVAEPATLTELQQRQLLDELDGEVAGLVARNCQLRFDRVATEESMEVGIASREAEIAAVGESARALQTANAAQRDATHLEQDRMQAALVAASAKATLEVAAKQLEVTAIQQQLNALEAFRLRSEQLNEELSAVREQHTLSDLAFERVVSQTKKNMEANETRWQREIEARAEVAVRTLRAKIEREVFNKFHTITADHARISAELGYQSHRIELLLAANACMERRKQDLDANIKREQQVQAAVCRGVRYQKRTLARQRDQQDDRQHDDHRGDPRHDSLVFASSSSSASSSSKGGAATSGARRASRQVEQPIFGGRSVRPADSVGTLFTQPNVSIATPRPPPPRHS